MNMKSYLTTTALLLAMNSLLSAQQVPPAPTLEQVLDNYPSRAELQSRVDAYKAAHLAEFAAAKADFDLAIRSMLTLEFPEDPYPSRRHVERKPLALPSYFSRPTVLHKIERCNEDTAFSEWKVFYQTHIDEIVVDETPALRYVYLDLLLNGWDDWANWQSQKLQDTRTAYPDLHLKYALRELCGICGTFEDLAFVSDTVGVVLPLVRDTARGRWIRDQAQLVIIDFVQVRKDVYLLRYTIDAAMNAPDNDTRVYLLSIAGHTSEALPALQRREFWVDYLQAPDEWIRTLAASGIAEAIRKARPGEAPRVRDQELAQLLQDVAQNDPSPRVRQFTQARLNQYETSDTKHTHGRGTVGGPIERWTPPPPPP